MRPSDNLNAVRAFFSPFSGLGYLFSPGLRRYVLVPLIINVLIFSLCAWAAVVYLDEYLLQMLPVDGWLSYLSWILWPLFVLLYVALTFFGFTLVANLIGAPFNSQLAARAERLFTGRLPPESSGSLLKEAIPAILTELAKLLHFIVLAVPLLILMLIPGLNAIAAVLWMLLGFWFLSLAYFDYPLGNHGLRLAEQRELLRNNPLSSWAFGAGVSVLMLTPILNFAAMPAAVVGATRLLALNPRRSGKA